LDQPNKQGKGVISSLRQWWCSSKRIGTERSEYVVVKVLPLEQVRRRQGKGPNIPSSKALPLPG